MHENEFEKQVQQKMEDLAFVPSDAVWQKVDQEINADKKRRRPLFWFFFLLGLLVAGGGYFYLTSPTKPLPLAGNDGRPSTPSKTSPGGQAADHAAKRGQAVEEGKSLTGNNNDHHKRIKQDGVRSIAKDQLASSDNQVPVQTTRNLDRAFAAPTTKVERRSPDAQVDEPAVTTVILHPSIPVEKSRALQDAGNPVPATRLTDLNRDSSNQAISKLSEPKKNQQSTVTARVKENRQIAQRATRWEWGYTASGGISWIRNGFLKPEAVLSSANANAGGSPNQLSQGSSIRNNFSFEAGAFIKRQFYKRIVISAGIGYHYFSTDIRVGKYADSTAIVYLNQQYSLNSPNVVPSASFQGYYKDSASHTYLNQYHLIELPLLLDWQLGKGLKWPVIWEAGLSISYLFTSDALQFDPNSKIYYKSYSLMNKVQMGGSTAVLLEARTRKLKVQFGPQFQYQFTQLLGKELSSPQHLFFGGIKVAFTPQKK